MQRTPTVGIRASKTRYSIPTPSKRIVLVQPRDPRVWARDPKLKTATKNVGSISQELTKLQRQYIRNYLKDWSTTPMFGMLSNVHLTIGNQRL